MKIIIVGAGLTGVTYALLLNREGYNVELYEKRPIDEIKNLDSVIYIKSETLKILSPFIDDDIFSERSPKAYKEGPREGIYPKLSIREDHACINIDDLLKSLLDASLREGITIHRKYELMSFSKNDDDTTHAVFKFNHYHNVIKTCDRLLLACGNRSIKKILENKYKLPVELHYTNVLGTRFPIDHSKFDHESTSSVASYPDVRYLPMIVAQLAAYYLRYCPTSIGSFSLYLASLSKFVMITTYPPERRDEFITNATSRVNFLRDRIKNMRTGLNIPNMNYQWLSEMEEKVNEDNVAPITAYSAVHVPDKSLLEQGVISIGDAFVTTPFIFGSEYNEHIQKAYPRLLTYLNKIKLVLNETEKNNALDDFIESLWEFILSKDGAGKYLGTTDLMGNTMLQDGTRVNLSPKIGYPLSRELLEKLSQQSTSWIPVPNHQDGGILLKTNKHTLFAEPKNQCHQPKRTSSNLEKLGFFSAGVVVGTTLTAGLIKLNSLRKT